MRNAEDTPPDGFARVGGPPEPAGSAPGRPPRRPTAPWGPAPQPPGAAPYEPEPGPRPGRADTGDGPSSGVRPAPAWSRSVRSAPHEPVLPAGPLPPPEPATRGPDQTPPGPGATAQPPGRRQPDRRPPDRPPTADPAQRAPEPDAGRVPAAAPLGSASPADPAPRRRAPRPAPAGPASRPGIRPPDASAVAVAGATPRDLTRHPGAAALGQIPYALALICLAGGIVWAWRGSHDVGNGAGLVGGGLLAAAVARLLLPPHAVGLLASRRRFADVLALGALGAGLLTLALVLPPT